MLHQTAGAAASKRLRPLVLFLTGAAILAAASVSYSFASALPPGGSQASGSTITLVRTASGNNFVTNLTDYVDVPGAASTVRVKGTALLLVAFAASDSCGPLSNDPGGWPCYVRALVNGEPLAPGEVIFDVWPANSGAERGAHAMNWSTGPLPPGSYTVQIQAKTSGPEGFPTGGQFTLGAWHLTVERVKT